MWNSLLIIIFLASDNISVRAELKAAEQSFYEHHHSPHGPVPVSYHGEQRHINSVGGGYFPQNQAHPVSYEQQSHPVNLEQQQPHPVSYEQPHPGNIGQPQPYPVNFEQQQPVSVRQSDPNINLTSVQVQPGGYWPSGPSPHGGFHHHPGYYPNGGVTFRTEPPNPSFFGPGFVTVNTATTTSATPTRNNVNTRQRTNSPTRTTESPPKESNLKLFQGRKNTRKKSQTLPQRKSQPTKYPQTKKKLAKSQDGDQQNVFNFSYIPEEFLDKGFPITPTLEIVRDQHGIPIVVPVFRPMPDSYNTTRRKQNKKSQRQQENQQQPPQQFFPGVYNQNPFTIQLSPFSNQLNNPFSQTNGFVPREVQNVTGPSLGLNIGWASPLPPGHFHSPIHPLVPYPYSHIGWGPYYFNATHNGEAAPTPAQKSNKPKPTKATTTKTTKSKVEKENVTEEKDEEPEEEEEENELGEVSTSKSKVRNKTKKNENKNHDDDDDEYEDDKNKEDAKNVRKQNQKDKDDDYGGNEVEVEYEDDYDDEDQNKKTKMQAKPIEMQEENYEDTEEVSEEIPQDVLDKMIQEYNEKNQDTPIIQEGDPAQQQIVDRLRKQIHSLLDMFATSAPTAITRGRNFTADDIEWTTRLRERYQLKTRPNGPKST